MDHLVKLPVHFRASVGVHVRTSLCYQLVQLGRGYEVHGAPGRERAPELAVGIEVRCTVAPHRQRSPAALTLLGQHGGAIGGAERHIDRDGVKVGGDGLTDLDGRGHRKIAGDVEGEREAIGEAGLGQQLLGKFWIVRVRLDVFVEAKEPQGEQTADHRAAAGKHELDDALAVYGVVQRSAHANVGQWLAATHGAVWVDGDVGGAHAGDARYAQPRVALDG